jgi:hypothetical protein
MKPGLQVLDDYQKYGYVVGAFGGSPLSPRGGASLGNPGNRNAGYLKSFWKKDQGV